MRHNLFLSGSFLAVLVPLAATGVLGLAAVVAIHELAEVVVIANGIRPAAHGLRQPRRPGISGCLAGRCCAHRKLQRRLL